jgi:glycosyltransferase involved in cell wall biosynthesis
MDPSVPAPSSDGARRIHVLEVVGNAIVGGMESWVERLIERLPPQRYAFTALCPFESPFTDRLRKHRVEVLVAPMPDELPWATLQMATALVSTAGVDLLHAHLPKAHLLAGIVGRMTGRPVLTTIHGRQLSTLDLEVHRASGSHVSVVCRQTYFHALGLGVGADHLSCETNGVDTQVFRPRPRRSEGSLRKTLGLEAQTPLVGFVGRLSPEKGPEVMVRAAMLLRHSRPDAHTVLVGEGPMADELRALVARFGLDKHLHLAGLRQDMPEVYNELDLLVSCSHSEAMPLAVMEAMASGVAVVATRVGGVPEIVEHGQTGWLVGPGDFDDIAGRCAWLLGDATLRSAMAARARERAIQRLGLDESVASVDRLLTRLAQGQKGQGATPENGVSATRSAATPGKGSVSPAGARGARQPDPAVRRPPLPVRNGGGD